MARSGAWLWIGVFACAEGDPEAVEADPCTTGQPDLVPGTGYDQLQELVPGDPVLLVNGQQGGWHVDVGGRVAEVGGDVAIEATLTVPELDGASIVEDQPTTFIRLVDHTDETCEGVFFGVRRFLAIDQAQACRLWGATLRYDLTVIDAATDRTVSASIDVVAALDDGEQEECSVGAR